METEEFTLNEFDKFLLTLIKQYQIGEITEYKKGAVAALLLAKAELQKEIDEYTEVFDTVLEGFEESDHFESSN